jgi:sugar phosphate isomerase/epimerase
MVRFNPMSKLTASLLAVFVLSVLPRALPAMPSSKGRTAKIPVGVQLYSVRDDAGKDLDAVLAAISRAGYEGIEYAGYYGHSAEELRKLQDKYGLKCCGTHTGLDTLMGDELQKTIDFNKTLGNKYLIVPWLPDERRASRAAWIATAKLFNEIAAKAKAQGMRVGYHAHAGDFQKVDGEAGWDVFFASAQSDVIMQIDTGNARGGGADPLEYIRKYRGRSATVHLKEYARGNGKALIGEGEIPWNDVFAACEKGGGVEWYIVEQEDGEMPMLECVAKDRENLKKMGK